MLNEKELNILRENAKIHKKVFDEIKKIIKDWIYIKEIDDLCWKIAKEHNVLCGFKWVYGFPNNICISINDVVVHWRVRDWVKLKNWDLLTLDFWIKDKKVWVHTDAAFSMIVWWDEQNPKWARLIEANKKALYAWIAMCKEWNRTWDVWYAIQKEIEKAGYKVVKELTGHAIWKTLHEKPYMYNYGTPWSWAKLKKGMLLCIEPILWETSGEITDKWDWEIYIKDWSLWSQYEHTILVTDSEPEIII